MKIFVVGGTGFLGYHTIQALTKKGHSAVTIALPPMPAPELLPEGVQCELGNMNEMSDDYLVELMRGCDGLVFAAGKDERIVPEAPAYPFFRKANVDDCVRMIHIGVRAGVKRAVVLNSYFATFARRWPELEMARWHPYVRSRIEQAQEAIAAGGPNMDVMILELPYIFGTMPGRTPLWTIFTDMFLAQRVVYYTSGGSACITAKQVGQAVVGALEQGRAGERYPIGWKNLTWKELYAKFVEYMGVQRKLRHAPKWLAKLFAHNMLARERRKGKEAGSNPVHFMETQCRETFIDPEPAMTELGYEPDDLDAAIADSVRACMATYKPR